MDNLNAPENNHPYAQVIKIIGKYGAILGLIVFIPYLAWIIISADKIALVFLPIVLITYGGAYILFLIVCSVLICSLVYILKPAIGRNSVESSVVYQQIVRNYMFFQIIGVVVFSLMFTASLFKGYFFDSLPFFVAAVLSFSYGVLDLVLTFVFDKKTLSAQRKYVWLGLSVSLVYLLISLFLYALKGSQS